MPILLFSVQELKNVQHLVTLTVAECLLFQMEELPYSHAMMDLLQKEIHTCSALMECGVLHHPSVNLLNQLLRT